MACGGLACILAPVVAAMRPDLALPKQKLILIAAQYGCLLPAILIALWATRGAVRSRREGTAAPRFRVIAALYLLLVVPLALLLHPGVYSADESTYLFQARCLRAGELYAQAPGLLDSEVHFTHHLIADGKWFGKYPFAWPALLALSGFLHLDGLINPLLGLLVLWLSHRLAERVFSSEEAWCGSLLLACSPFFTLNCLGYMSHVACGAAVATATLCCFRAVDSQGARWIALTGACVAAATLIRPYTGLCVAIALGGVLLAGLRRRIPALAAGAAAILPILAVTGWILGATNQALTGSFTRSAYAAYHGVSVPVEISASPAVLARVLLRTTPIRLADTMIAGFAFVFPLAACALWFRRRSWRVWALAVVFAALVLGHVVQQEDSDSPIGERYYWEGFFAVSILAGVGWAELEKRAQWSAALRRSAIGWTVVATAAAMVFFGKGQWQFRWRYREIARAADAAPVRSGVVFLEPSRDYFPVLYNPNRPGGKLLFIPDPGKDKRARIAAKAGAQRWTTLTYSNATNRAQWTAPQ